MPPLLFQSLSWSVSQGRQGTVPFWCRSDSYSAGSPFLQCRDPAQRASLAAEKKDCQELEQFIGACSIRCRWCWWCLVHIITHGIRRQAQGNHFFNYTFTSSDITIPVMSWNSQTLMSECYSIPTLHRNRSAKFQLDNWCENTPGNLLLVILE